MNGTVRDFDKTERGRKNSKTFRVKGQGDSIQNNMGEGRYAFSKRHHSFFGGIPFYFSEDFVPSMKHQTENMHLTYPTSITTI
jgi:hypothetical protein